MNPKKSVCRYNKFGYCKFSDKCHFRHNDIICNDKNCNVFNCEKRHPKICTFYRDFGRCKFTNFCKYNHEKQIDIKENSEKIKEMETKLQKLEKSGNVSKDASSNNEKIKNLETKTENIQNKISEKDLEFEKQINILQNKIQTLIKATEEKDSLIMSMNKKIEAIENNLKNILCERNTSKIEEIEVEEEILFKCEDCNFTSSSKQGLKTHR